MSGASAAEDVHVASQQEVEAFQNTSDPGPELSQPLKGVLAEIANTGVLRYPWHLVRPLVVHVMSNVLQQYEAAEEVEVGPPLPLPHDAGVDALTARFKRALWGFSEAPWTVQRLCELLLEPRKQYTKLSKLALALDKLLTVTSMTGWDPQPPPLPRLSELRAVNENPPRTAPSLVSGRQPLQLGKRPREGDEGLGLVSVALEVQPLNGFAPHPEGPRACGGEPSAAPQPMEEDAPAGEAVGGEGGRRGEAAAAAEGSGAAVDADAGDASFGQPARGGSQPGEACQAQRGEGVRGGEQRAGGAAAAAPESPAGSKAGGADAGGPSGDGEAGVTRSTPAADGPTLAASAGCALPPHPLPGEAALVAASNGS